MQQKKGTYHTRCPSSTPARLAVGLGLKKLPYAFDLGWLTPRRLAPTMVPPLLRTILDPDVLYVRAFGVYFYSLVIIL
jgi:hypothetical protein